MITAKDANLMVSTEINIFGVDASNASGLMLATGEGGNDLETQLTLSVSGGKIFDLTGFTLATIDGQNLVLKLTTSKGSETFTFSWANNSWSFSLVNATHPEYFTGVTEVVITEATGAQFIWGLDNIALSNIGGNTNAPPTTTVSTAGLSADTGTSSSDFITNTASQTITGTLSAVLAVGEKVQVSYDNGSTWSDASTYSVGSNSWTATTTLSGSNTFQARVANASGFSVAYTHSYALDTTAPTITFSNLSLQTDTGSSNSDFITNIASQNINATLSSTPGAGDVVTGSLDGGATWTDITSKVSGVTLSWNGVTISGSNTLMLKVVDAAGNDGSISSHAYTLDTMVPTTTVASVSFSNDTGISGSDFITNTASQTISGTLSANLQLGETVWVSINGGTTWTAATATVGQNTWSLAGVTLASSSTLCVKVTDTAGNDGTTLVRSYTYDTTAPTITFSGLGFSSDSGAAGDFITNTPARPSPAR